MSAVDTRLVDIWAAIVFRGELPSPDVGVVTGGDETEKDLPDINPSPGPAKLPKKTAPTVLVRNSTSFPVKFTAKLRELYTAYLALRQAGDNLALNLKYYQYLVRTVMSNPEFGIGVDGNARGLLIYQTMGMGKTRLAVAVAMAVWDIRQPVVLLARGLQPNFIGTVEQVVAVLNPDATPDELAALQRAAVARFAFVSMDAYNAADQMSRVGTGAEKNRRAKHASTLFASSVGGLDNKILIVDEAHNFFRAIINSSAENANARRMYDMAMSANNLRIVFLTGTPASKNPFELVPCFNMIAGYDLLPTQYDTFCDFYVDKVNRAVRNRALLSNRLIGLVSHVTHRRPSEPEGAGSPPPRQPRDDGWFPEELPTIVEHVEMGREQYRRYLLAREKDEASRGSGSGSGRPTPPLALPGSEKKAMRSYYVKSRSLCTFAVPHEWLSTPTSALSADAFVAEAGPKLELIASRAAAAPGPVLVYSQFVDASGLGPLAGYLRRLGFVEYTAKATDSANGDATNNAYATISGEVEPAMRDTIKEAFNSPANVRGAVIKAILVSKTGAEGLDLKYLRETHQVEPYWDRARDDQVKARAVRMGCLDALPREDRVVQPYLYVAAANREIWDGMIPTDREKETIDEQFFRRAAEQYEINNAFREVLGEVCLECDAFGYGNCRTCVPTDAPLFSPDDPGNDLRLPDPCQQRGESEVDAAPIVVDGVTYWWRADPGSPLGYAFFEHRADLGGYSAVDPSSPIVARLLRALGVRR